MSKTLGLPLFATSASAWFSHNGGHLGDVIAAMNKASAAGPAILLLDELDAVPNRQTVDARYRDYWTPVVTTLLLALDSVASAAANLVVIGATNHADRLDPALVRPGRLNRVVTIGLPGPAAIAGILRQHLGEALPGADLMPFGILGEGASGAVVAGWAKGARAAARAAGRPMVLVDLTEQVCPPETRPPDAVRAIARHEAAHAVAVLAFDRADLGVVTLVERGASAGTTRLTLTNSISMSAADVDALVVTMLAGRAADEHFGVATSGASADLAAATCLIVTKIGAWGLGGSLLHRGEQDRLDALLLTDPLLRRSVEEELDRLYRRAVDLIRENADVIARVASHLVEARVLSGAAVRGIVDAFRPSAGRPEPIGDERPEGARSQEAELTFQQVIPFPSD